MITAQRDFIICRCIAKHGAAAPDIRPFCLRCTCPLESVALIADLGRSILVNDGFRLFSRPPELRGVRLNVDAIGILDQSAAADLCIVHMKLTEAFNLCFARIRQREQRIVHIHVGIEIKINRREVLDIVCLGVRVDIERVVRHLAGIGGVLAAINRAVDGVARCHGARAVAEVDGVARYFSRAAGIATVDPVQDAALDGDDVAFHIAVSIAIATVDISCACDGAAFDEHFVLEHVTVRLIACRATVDTSMHVAALERRRVFLDGSCAAISRHTADQVAVELIAVECGMIVLYIAAAICSAAEYSVRD